MKQSYSTISEALKAMCLEFSLGLSEHFTMVSQDSRELVPGSLFLALPGANMHGIEFAEQAIQNGAIAIVTDQMPTAQLLAAGQVIDTSILFQVDSSLDFLWYYAKQCRAQSRAQFIAVTGSCGKTTTKEMLRRTLQKRFCCHASRKSYNNVLGVGLTLANLRPEHEVAVVEVGTNAPGEIAELTELVRPHIALITSIGAVHLAGLGSVEGVALEKSAIFSNLLAGGHALVDISLPHQAVLKAEIPKHANVILLTHSGGGASFSWVLQDQQCLMSMRFAAFDWAVKLPIMPDYWYQNVRYVLLVAALMGLNSGEVSQSFIAYQPAAGRGNVLQIGDSKILDHTYNANPLSMRAALSDLVRYSGPRIAVIGTMGELGQDALSEHLSLVVHLNGMSELLHKVYFVGEYADQMANATLGVSVERCFDEVNLIKKLKIDLAAGCVLMLKASRFVALDQVVAQLMSH